MIKNGSNRGSSFWACSHLSASGTIAIKAGKAAPAPEVELTEKAKAAEKCVMSTEYMKAEHMQLLDLWRHSVVRNAEREFVNPEGKTFNMSLSNTCLDCHSNKAEFCDRCHNYASVAPTAGIATSIIQRRRR
jgi:hypothetical protein